MALRIGVDVGGTFTDVLLFDEEARRTTTAKVPSTPTDSSRAVLLGIARVCAAARVAPSGVDQILHGTTVATNAVLTQSGARVGLVTTRGYRQVLHIARSFVPGGLGAWVIYQPSPPLAPLELTVEADERIGADGGVVTELDEGALRDALAGLAERRIESLTVSLLHAYANDRHERRVREIATEILPGIPVSLSSEVIPEMQEYERTVTTVANAYVRPVVERYLGNLSERVGATSAGVRLDVLRSDGGLAAAEAAARVPVNLLMSGPAGGVAGAIWVARQAGYQDLLTLDMGGTSTDVCMVRGGRAQTRRETTVGDLTVRAPSLDVRTVGAGGGSIAHVPELTGALRVGPESAGADPGPAAYGRGGEAATVTDANVVLGTLPAAARLGGEMALDRKRAEQALAPIAEARGVGIREAAAGIIDVVNETLCGALRLVSVERGLDPRDFALVAFGGAGPLHANALGRLMQAWPVIVPPGPGVLCALGEATTRRRNEASRSLVRAFAELEIGELTAACDALAARAASTLDAAERQAPGAETRLEIDVRYRGQGLVLPVETTREKLVEAGLDAVGEAFDALHEQLFTFSLPAAKEVVNLRAIALGPPPPLDAPHLEAGDGDPRRAVRAREAIFVDGREVLATIYDRSALRAGDTFPGPAIAVEMDATTLVLPGCAARVDDRGNLRITPHPEP